MSGTRAAHAAAVADAIAGAYLAGEWEPAAMGRRAKRALGDRRKWLTDLAHIVRAGFPERPADRPRELSEFVSACSVFIEKVRDRDRPLHVHVWMSAPTEMAAARWPVARLPTVAALATWLDLSLPHLEWFADRRSLEGVVPEEPLRHYHRRWIGKADGSVRLLEAPKRELKQLQRQVLHEILDRIPPHDAAHGFRTGRSARTGAAHHRGRAVVMRLDLESFFTSVRAGRVYGVFRTAGYPEPVAHTLAALCTTVTPTTVLRDAPNGPDALREQRRRMLRGLREPHLPQGSPTSPALANLCAYRLDRRLSGLARSLGVTYTRYADDLVLSGDRSLVRAAPAIVRAIDAIAREEGFKVHELKTRVFTAAQRQTVTGLVVNAHSNVPRHEYDRLRAVLHHAATAGPAAANRDGHADFRAHLLGRIGWAGAENERRAAKLQRAFDAINW